MIRAALGHPHDFAASEPEDADMTDLASQIEAEARAAAAMRAAARKLSGTRHFGTAAGEKFVRGPSGPELIAEMEAAADAQGITLYDIVLRTGMRPGQFLTDLRVVQQVSAKRVAQVRAAIADVPFAADDEIERPEQPQACPRCGARDASACDHRTSAAKARRAAPVSSDARFADQLARVAQGARVVERVIVPRRPDPAVTLGGVGSAML
jgi:hypothetical protein